MMSHSIAANVWEVWRSILMAECCCNSKSECLLLLLLRNIICKILTSKITNLIENRQQAMLFGNTVTKLLWLKYCGIRIWILLVSDKSFSNCTLYYCRICYFMTLKPVRRTYLKYSPRQTVSILHSSQVELLVQRLVQNPHLHRKVNSCSTGQQSFRFYETWKIITDPTIGPRPEPVYSNSHCYILLLDIW